MVGLVTLTGQRSAPGLTLTDACPVRYLRCPLGLTTHTLRLLLPPISVVNTQTQTRAVLYRNIHLINTFPFLLSRGFLFQDTAFLGSYIHKAQLS